MSHLSGHYMHTSIHSLFNMGGNGGNIIIDFNAFHHSNQLRLLICYTGHFDEKKTVSFASVAICVRSYRLDTVLYL